MTISMSSLIAIMSPSILNCRVKNMAVPGLPTWIPPSPFRGQLHSALIASSLLMDARSWFCNVENNSKPHNMHLLIEIFGEGKDLTFLQMTARGIVVFFLALLLIRISGRRSFGMHMPLDNIISIMLG